MIRVIVDKLGGGHSDLFLKIDSMPTHASTADSYYLFDFLEIQEDQIENQQLAEPISYLAIRLIEYWIERICSIEKGQEQFVPFGLFDEYIDGLLIKKSKLGFKVKRVWSKHLHGYAINKSTLDEQIKVPNGLFEPMDQVDWLVGEESLVEGLRWSIAELSVKAVD